MTRKHDNSVFWDSFWNLNQVYFDRFKDLASQGYGVMLIKLDALRGISLSPCFRYKKY